MNKWQHGCGQSNNTNLTSTLCTCNTELISMPAGVSIAQDCIAQNCIAQNCITAHHIVCIDIFSHKNQTDANIVDVDTANSCVLGQAAP